jgi:hypothetical protein
MRFLKLPCIIPIALLGCLAIGCNENGMPVGGQYVSPESPTTTKLGMGISSMIASAMTGITIA